MKKDNNKLYQRVLALVLAVMLCVGMMPMAAFAEGVSHQYGSVTKDNMGRECVVCNKCGTTCYQIDGDGHKATAETVLPTCEDDGYIAYTCRGCNYYERGEIIPKLNHDWGEWKVVISASDNATGLRQRVCKNDNSHVQEETIPKLKPDFYTLTVIYVDVDTKAQIGKPEPQDLAVGASTENQRQNVPEGYTYDHHVGPETMSDHADTLTVYCKAITPENPTFYNLTVHYWKEGQNGEYEKFRSETQQIEAGSDISKQFNDGKEVPDGYYFEKIVGDSTMPPKDYELNVYYALYRTVTIHYLEEGTGNILRAKAEISVKKGESISKDSPEIPGYTPDKGKVEFDNIQEDKNATVWYSPIPYKVIVKYVEAGTNELIGEPYEETHYIRDEVKITPTAPEGWKLVKPATPIEFTMGAKDEEIWIHCERPTEYTITIKYVDENGNEFKSETVPTTNDGEYDVTDKAVDTDGYTYVSADKDLTGKVIEDTTITLTFRQDEVPETYTVTYSWNLPAGADRTLPTNQSYKAGEPVTVDTEFTSTSTVSVGDRTYTFSGWSMGNFTMPAENVTINGTWRDTTPTQPDIPSGSSTPTPTPTPTPSPAPSTEPSTEPTEDIPDPTPPLTDTPDITPEPTATPVVPDPEPPVQIPEEDPPLAEIPDDDPPLAEPPDGTTEIDDEEVPLADVPKTGDDAKIWLTLALLSAAGLGVLGLTQRRTRKSGKHS